MLKKLRRYSSRSIPIKKLAKFHVKTIQFDKPGSPVADQFRLSLVRDKRNAITSTRSLNRADNIVIFDETISLRVTFYQDSKGKVQEKRAQILVLGITAGSQTPILIGSADLQLQHYYSETSSSHELNLVILSNGRPSGAVVKGSISFVEDLSESIDDNGSDMSDSISVNSESTGEARLPNAVSFATPGFVKVRSVENIGSLDFLSPIEEDHGVAALAGTPPRYSMSAKFDYDDLEFKNPNPLLSDIDLLKHEEIASLNQQLTSSKCEITKKQEEIDDLKAKLQHAMALMELQSSGKSIRSGVTADGDWIPDASTPVKMEEFQSPGVAWSSNPMGVHQLVSEHRRRASVKELKVMELSNETEMQQELINILRKEKDDLSTELLNLRTEWNSKTDSVMTLTSKLTEAITERDQARAEMNSATAALSAANLKYDTAARGFEVRIDTLTEENQKLKSDNAVVAGTNSELLVQICNLESTVDSKSLELTILQSELSYKDSQISSLSDKITVLQDQLKQAADESHSRFRNTLQSEMEFISVQLQESKAESSQQEELNQTIQSEMSSLSSRLVELDLIAGQVPQLLVQVGILQDQRGELGKECDQRKENEKQLCSQIDQLTRQAGHEASEKQAALDSCASVTAAFKDQGVIVDHLRKENLSLQDSLQLMNSQLTELEGENSSLRLQLDESKTEIDSKLLELEASSSGKERLALELKELSTHYEKCKAEWNFKFAEFTVVAESVRALESLLDLSEKRCLQYQNEIRELEGRLERVQSEFEQSSSSLVEKKRELQHLTETLQLSEVSRESSAEELGCYVSLKLCFERELLESRNLVESLTKAQNALLYELAIQRNEYQQLYECFEIVDGSLVSLVGDLCEYCKLDSSSVGKLPISELDLVREVRQAQLSDIISQIKVILLRQFEESDGFANECIQLAAVNKSISSKLDELDSELELTKAEAVDQNKEIFALANENKDLETQMKLMQELLRGKDHELAALNDKVAEMSKNFEIIVSEKRIDEMQVVKLVQEMSRMSNGKDLDMLAAVAAESNFGETNAETIAALETSASFARIEMESQIEELIQLRNDLAAAKFSSQELQTQLAFIENLYCSQCDDDVVTTEIKSRVCALSISSSCPKPQAALILLLNKMQSIAELESQNLILRNALDGMHSPNRKKSDQYSSFGGPEDLHRRSQPSKPSIGGESTHTAGGQAITWAKNEDFPNCKACNRPFNRLTRWRHHCRFCGLVFCNPCTPHKIRFPYSDPSSQPLRACACCAMTIK